MKDERSKTSAENGKKGGRPKSSATLQTQKQRELLLKKLEKEAGPIFNKLIEKAKAGDVAATKELFDRAYGKAPQKFDDEDLERLPPLLVKIITNDERDSDGDTRGV